MADQNAELDALRDLLDGTAALGQLAKSEKPFVTAYEAFRSEDRKAFQAILQRLKLGLRCRLVCEWIRIKECVFLCLELCGPPPAEVAQPDPRVLAEAVVRATSDDRLLQQLVQAVEKRDRAAFQELVKELQLERFCHFFCHWVCMVRYRLVCRWLCELEIEERPNLAAELAATGHALRVLLENGRAFDEAVAASDAGDAAKFGSAINSVGLLPFCGLICEWFCSRRCVLACWTLCREFPLKPLPVQQELREAFAFAQAMGTLGQKPGAVQRLNAAVGAGDPKAFAAVLTELKLQRFCIQLCHWICFLRCRRFCIPACPPEELFPVFTSIGGYDYLTDIHSAVGGSGLTVGDDRAFFSTLRLNGILTQTLGGQPMEYRFETQPTDAAGNPTGPWTPVLPGQIGATLIGHWEHFNFITMTIETKKYWVNHAAGPTDLVTTIAPDGWIQVPQENNFLSPAGAFSSNGNMIELISNSLAPFPSQNETGTTAGGPAHHALAEDVYFGMRMRVRQVGNPASETNGGTCEHVAIDDTLYDNITLHTDWDGGLQSPGQLAVRMLDIDELIAHPCGEITNSLTVEFTAAHPNLGSVSIVMTGPGGPYSFALPAIPEVGDWYGIANPTGGWTVSKLKPCAYLVTLEITVLLTTGDDIPDPLYDQIAFCKK